MSGPLSGKTIAVTGAGGFIGGRLVERLAQYQVVIMRVARAGQPAVSSGVAPVIDVIGDVRDRATWDRIADADVILHLAAQTSVAAAQDDPERDFEANVRPMQHLIDACRAGGHRPLVVFAGTVTQAGLQEQLPVNEHAVDEPITAYDRHKLLAERALTTAAAEGTLSGTSLRLCNVYGPGAPGRGVDRDVLNRMIRCALDGRPITVYGSGNYIRDYVFIDDVVEAFVLAASHPDRVSGRHFVIGSGTGITIREAFELVASRVERATGRAVAVNTVAPATPLTPIEHRQFVADPSSFCSATGWRPAWSLSDGIDRTIEEAGCVSS